MPVDLAAVAAPGHTAVLTMEIQRGVVGDLTSFPQLAEAADRVGVVPNTARLLGAARALGQPPGVSRAIGAALGANPWPLLVPCHRIVAADGKMTGFSGPGGIRTKLRLLALEGAELFAE